MTRGSQSRLRRSPIVQMQRRKRGRLAFVGENLPPNRRVVGVLMFLGGVLLLPGHFLQSIQNQLAVLFAGLA
jgi:hypothetical protein